MFLPEFKDCMAVVEANDAFTHKVEEVDGLKFHIFNYRLANYEDFQKYPGAIEMRGLTFLEYQDPGDASGRGVLYQRFLHLHKFFNLGQGDENEAARFCGQKITRVQNKEDGSMIVPIVVNGKIYCKTRGTFFSEMALDSNKMIAADDRLRDFILINDAQGMALVFEYVGPYNQIVLRYQEKELRLLQMRDKTTGRYVQFDDTAINVWAVNFGLQVAPQLIIPEGGGLGFWVSEAQEGIDFEGYVITFENGHIIKLKTDWYVHLHHLLTENLTRENELIKLILEEKLDDVLAQVPQDDIRRLYALDISKWLRHEIRDIAQITYGNVQAQYSGDRKSFALKFLKHPFFSMMMKMVDLENQSQLNKNSAFDIVRVYVLKLTDKWLKAQKFLKDAGFYSKHQPPSMEE